MKMLYTRPKSVTGKLGFPADIPWWKQPTVFTLVITNLVPIAGVIFAKWDVIIVLILFWLETLFMYFWLVLDTVVYIAGGYLVFFYEKLHTSEVEPRDDYEYFKPAHSRTNWIKLPIAIGMILFFVYFVFYLISLLGSFIIYFEYAELQGMESPLNNVVDILNPVNTVMAALAANPTLDFYVAVAVLFINYGVQIISNLLIKDDSEKMKTGNKYFNRISYEVTKRVILLYLIVPLLAVVFETDLDHPYFLTLLLVIVIGFKILIDVSDFKKQRKLRGQLSE